MYINGYNFDKVVAVLRKEFKGKAIDPVDGCVYLSGEGKKCAVGCFISPQKYQEKFEGRSLTDIWRCVADDMPMNLHYMNKLQDFHDHNIDENDPDFVQLDALIWKIKCLEDSFEETNR